MYHLIILIISILYSCFALAKNSYQIDIILFAHPQSAHNVSDSNAPLIPVSKNATPLKNNPARSSQPYNLLPPSKSGLRDEYYLLSRKSKFRVLGQYSWKQTNSNQNTVAIPKVEHQGWLMQGTMHIQQGSYYLFDAKLQCSAPSNPQGSFMVSQKQRLKDNVVYYLDHPQIGMVVKIHKLS